MGYNLWYLIEYFIAFKMNYIYLCQYEYIFQKIVELEKQLKNDNSTIQIKLENMHENKHQFQYSMIYLSEGGQKWGLYQLPASYLFIQS